MSDLIDKIYEAGVVGCGGAGFPTHVKLNGKFKWLIINALECEPLLRTDRFVMRNEADKIIKAILSVKEHTQAEHAVIGLKREYKEEIASLENAITKYNADIKLKLFDSFYPAGDEQVLAYEVTGKVVPPSGIPKDVDAVVSNVSTMLAIGNALDDMPLCYKYITVTGAVNEPMIVYAPVGAKIVDCINLAKPIYENYMVISGGPMMGKHIEGDAINESVVTKTSSGLIVLPMNSKPAMEDLVSIRSMLNRAKSACIQCQRCTELCSRHLLGHPLEPHRIMRKLAYNTDINSVINDKDISQALICSECGICEEVACPMGLNPRKVNAYLKTELRKAGIRYEKQDIEFKPLDDRKNRLIPTKVAAARAGVGKYYHTNVTTFKKLEVSKVEIPLQQHIGAPAKPIVNVGDEVTAGSKIAVCQEGSLGANIHTGISGKVVSVGNSIVIKA